MAEKCNCVWIGKGVKGTSGCIMTQWRANANMPSFNLCGGDCFTYGIMCRAPYGEAASYNASTLCRGFEIFQGAAMMRYCIGESDCLNGIFCRCIEWIHCDGSTMFAPFAGQHCINMCTAPGWWQWQYYFYFVQMGTNCWEIDVDGCYCLRNCVTCVRGDDLSIATNTCAVCVTNVPTAPTTGSSGDIWVEGNNLNFVPEQQTETWEHSMAGDCQSAAGAGTAGSIWVDTSHYLNWVGGDSNVYRAKWRICQFCSWFGGGPGANPAPGAGYAGAIWMDGEFGYSHLAYIGCDGNKYITGAGNCPHIAP